MKNWNIKQEKKEYDPSVKVFIGTHWLSTVLGKPCWIDTLPGMPESQWWGLHKAPGICQRIKSFSKWDKTKIFKPCALSFLKAVWLLCRYIFFIVENQKPFIFGKMKKLVYLQIEEEAILQLRWPSPLLMREPSSSFCSGALSSNAFLCWLNDAAYASYVWNRLFDDLIIPSPDLSDRIARSPCKWDEVCQVGDEWTCPTVSTLRTYVLWNLKTGPKFIPLLCGNRDKRCISCRADWIRGTILSKRNLFCLIDGGQNFLM